MNLTMLFIGGIGMQEVLLAALIVLLFFGGEKIPELMRGTGKGMGVYRNSHKLKITLATDSCSESDFNKRGVSTHLHTIKQETDETRNVGKNK